MLVRSSRVAAAVIGLLVACTAVSLAGYAIFALHPSRVASNITVARLYAAAISGLPRLHILLGGLAIATILIGVVGGRWIIAAVALYVASLGSELLGTSIGKPFGPYRYTDALGTKWFGLVPLVIPLSWLTMTLASFAIARCTLGVRRRLTTIAVGSALLVAWDLALDPAMSRLTPYWIWGTDGPYFGMPLLNILGWGLTGVMLHAILLALRADGWVDTLPSSAVRAVIVVYAANLALPVGMTMAANLPLAAAASLAALGSTMLLTRLGRAGEARPVRRAPPSAEVAR